ncbi:MAG: protein translocase subunit SecF [Deltaproteobacteria bacterium]|nr:MAG: protein translocase subunit SecF [Deltaproteobacteria bacterium]
MEIVRPGTNIDFVGKRKYALFASLLLVVLSLALLLIQGPHYGIDFSGGTLIQVRFEEKVEADRLRGVLGKVGLGDAILQPFGGAGEYLIKTKLTSGKLRGLRARIEEAFREELGSGFEIRRVEMVGPKVGRDLRSKGIKAVIFALIGILIYISWRFEVRFALGAVAALVHDVIITLGAFTASGRELNLPVVAALLTIVGYSLNDTIVVYDRIRENMKKLGTALDAIINRSINETLNRTILTSLTTLITVVVLFFLGGGIIKDFAFALIVGIVVGTYSSIYIASPIVLFLERAQRK